MLLIVPGKMNLWGGEDGSPGTGDDWAGFLGVSVILCGPYRSRLLPGLLLLFSCSVVSDSDPMDCSTPGSPVHHQLPEFTQTHVH